MPRLLKQDIKDGLYALGVRRGMNLMVHSSLSGFGEIEGGAECVIDALIGVLGGEGTLLMPSFSSPDNVFDYRKSACGLGKIPDVFWRRSSVKRSLHPTHSVSAAGPLADYFLEGHENADTAYGEGTPYKRLIDRKGFVLMLGVDLDRLTLLHTVEALSDAAYLTSVKRDYVDSEGLVKTAFIEKMAGPHRNFISLDRPFRKNGILKTSKIGGAVCRLIDSAKMFNYCMERMKYEPDMMLCKNSACEDCNMQRGGIRERDLSKEDFILCAAVEGSYSNDLDDYVSTARNEGIRNAVVSGEDGLPVKEVTNCISTFGFKTPAVNIGIPEFSGKNLFVEEAAEKACVFGAGRIIFSLPADSNKRNKLLNELKKAADYCGSRGLDLLIENGALKAAGLEFVMEAVEKNNLPNLGLAYNPANFAFEGGRPFLDFVRKLKYVSVLYVNDGLKNKPGSFTAPGEGNAEIKEIISALRARSFSGLLVVKPPECDYFLLKEHAGAFRNLLLGM
jgi:aminoglycoside 3-N-acetyltransferase